MHNIPKEWVTSGPCDAWTDEDYIAALKEGWIMTNDGDNKMVIAKVDEPSAWPEHTRGEITYSEPLFKFDEDAMVFVIKRAKEGASHACKAIMLSGMPWD